MLDETERRRRTKEMATRLFSTIEGGVGFDLWKRFDKELARELSLFYTGVLYSRDVISQRTRELCACASLTALGRTNELRIHVHAALNVGATNREIAEVIFQQVTYAGMPVVVEGLHCLRDVLVERGEWPSDGTG